MKDYGDPGFYFPGDYVKTKYGRTEWKVLEVTDTTARLVSTETWTEKTAPRNLYRAA